jgi:cytochrome c5
MKKRRAPYRVAVLIAVVAAGVWISGMGLFARADENAQAAPAVQQGSRDHEQKSGEQVFMQNCSRCHKPPMTISPRITGTVVMHMRVRAKLSREDEQALLHYLAP